MRFVIIGLILGVSLTGCSTALSDLLAQSVAPDVIVYTPEQMKKVSTEMVSGQCPMSNELIIDYGVMRDQARIAKGGTVNIKR